MPEADETIITQFLVEADKAIEETERFQKKTDELKKELKLVADETKINIEDMVKSLQRLNKEELKSLDPDEITKDMQEFGAVSSKALKDIQQEGKQAAQILKNLSGINLAATRMEFERTRNATVSFLNALRGAHQATQPFGERIRNFTSSLSELGNVGKYIFGTVFGIGAVQAIRQVIEVFKEAITASLEFQQSLFTLEVAIRGLQRIGLDTTIASWDRQLEELKKQFPIFSRKEFTDAASLAALMTREFGFTEAQIADLVKQSAILSEITGKDLNEAVRGVTFAIGSGYFESLQRAGINISRQVVANKALELGYEGVYNELEPVIRASITYAVIQDNLNAIQEDAGRIVDTTAGRVKELRARWEDFLITLGQTVTETEEAKTGIEALSKSLELLTEIIGLLGSDPLFSDKSLIELLLGPAFPSFLSDFKDFNEQVEVLLEYIRELRGERTPILDDLVDEDQVEALQDLSIGGVEFSKEDYDEIIKATEELAEEIEQIEEEGFEKRQDAFEKFLTDRDKLAEKHQQKLIDLEEDLSRRLADINLKAEQRTADEISSNAFRVEEVIRKAAFRREDAERKFRERELSSERKFQEKLRQLRENFLLDLEDAVRERDARQIIRLTRQFNLRRDQMKREEGLSSEDRQAQFQEELRQIERQKQERLRQLAIEHQRRLDAITRQAERERQQAQVDAERRKEEERLRFEQQKQDRIDRLAETLDSINESTQERINAVIQGLQDEYDLSKDQLDAISMLYENAYGPDGRIDRAVAYTIARLQQLAQFMNILRTSMGTVPDLHKERMGQQYDYAGEQAEGGTIVARKPTVAIFGEAGPERATFTPLNRLGSQGGTKLSPTDVSSMSRDGRIRLELLLSPDLEGRIIDNTLGEMADINFAIERARK